MGAYRAADPAGQARRRQTARRYPRGDQRRDVRFSARRWRALPKDLPPRSTVHERYLGLWNCDGTLDRIHHARSTSMPEKAAAKPAPRPAIIDPDVKSARKRGARIDSHGFVPLIKGRSGMFWSIRLAAAGIVTAADVQDRDGGLALLGPCAVCFPFSGNIVRRQRLWPVFHRAWPASCPISRPRSSSDPRLQAQVVERTIAWLNRCRRWTGGSPSVQARVLDACSAL